MKNFISLAILFLLFQSCAPKIIPIKGSYIDPPFIYITTANKDSVWDKLIDLFAQQGLSIKIIDRSSGLIISEPGRLSATIEDKSGNTINSFAYIVVPKILNTTTKKYIPAYGNITGEINVRIKEQGRGTSININIVNVHYETLVYGKAPANKILDAYKSTGVFEKIVTNYIK